MLTISDIITEHEGATTTLHFLYSEDEYSAYETNLGETVYLEHGTGRQLFEVESLDIDGQWETFLVRMGLTSTSMHYYATRQQAQREFREYLASIVIDEDEIDLIVAFCYACGAGSDTDDLHNTGYEGDGDRVCITCYQDRYLKCDGCDYRYSSTSTISGYGERCEGCLDEDFSYCSSCEEYYHDADSGMHDHSGSGCCESPAQQFSIRNNGDGYLRNDQQVRVTLPAGEISDEGLAGIGNVLRRFGDSLLDGVQTYVDNDCYNATTKEWDVANAEREKYYALANQVSYNDALGNKWQTKDGNFTKRLSRYGYKTYALKIAPQVISEVGNIARDHSKEVDFDIEVTRNLNLSPEEFAHEDSCWWQSYSSSRCALKTNGGFGLRTFRTHAHSEYHYVTGRAWVMPLRVVGTDEEGRAKLTPTFETKEPDAFVVFNGYEDLEGYAAARIMSHMAGMTYRKIAFSCSPMYVNSDSGYLIAPEEIADPYTDGALYLDTSQHASLYDDELEALETAENEMETADVA